MCVLGSKQLPLFSYGKGCSSRVIMGYIYIYIHYNWAILTQMGCPAASSSPSGPVAPAYEDAAVPVLRTFVNFPEQEHEDLPFRRQCTSVKILGLRNSKAGG